MTLDDTQALSVLNVSQQVPPFIEKSRKEAQELFALLEGDGFIKELIERIEYVESEEKAIARQKYSRDVAHLLERILRPVDNVYSANGGSKVYNIDDKNKRMELMKKLGRIRNGKSLQEWLKANWMPLYHSDPNGVIFMEYISGDDAACWPTYKNIDHIRSYVPRGQMIEWILFEPETFRISGEDVEVWRLVDDVMDRRYRQNGNDFVLIEEINGVKVTFEHPFGQTPALINSDIEKLRGNHRLSPIEKIRALTKEYARDQSIKTLYKKYMGIPKEWKYVEQCQSCFGAKKDTEGKKCVSCDGHGYYKAKDITDIVNIKLPEKDDIKITPDIGGFVVPPIDVWQRYDDEIELLEKMAHRTHWGTVAGFMQNIAKTATEIILNTQPMTNRLNAYSDVAEMMEGQLTEWVANFEDPLKDKDERIAYINYPRRYIIDPPDVILEKYQKAKEKGDNNVILDRLFNEYLTAKWRNDPEFLRVMLLKADVEPYIHLSIEQVTTTFNKTEAQRKVLFESWWNTLKRDDMKKKAKDLFKEFDAWFQDQIKDQATEPNEGDGE